MPQELWEGKVTMVLMDEMEEQEREETLVFRYVYQETNLSVEVPHQSNLKKKIENILDH